MGLGLAVLPLSILVLFGFVVLAFYVLFSLAAKKFKTQVKVKIKTKGNNLASLTKKQINAIVL